MKGAREDYFQAVESRSCSISLPLQELIARLGFDESGLLPVVTQDARSKKVLMLGWMNLEALNQTLSTGMVTYWSKTKQQLWVQGELTGNIQKLVSIAVDGDGESILCKVKQVGTVSDLGRSHTFYIDLKPKTQEAIVEGLLFKRNK